MKKRRNGFSLAEMMIVMLIISIITAAMLPVVTKRQKDSGSGGGHCLWTESASNSADIYSRESGNASVLVGTTARLGSGNEKMQINTTTAGTPQLGLAVNGTVTGALWADSSNDLFLGSITKDAASANNNTVIGQQDSISNANNSTVVGSYTKGGNSGVAIGYTASSLGSYNTAVGVGALASSSSASSNTAIGQGALASNSSGSTNTAVGEGALTNNTASGNAAFGCASLQRNSSGTYNTVLGTYAMTYNQGGNNNTAVGYAANNQTDITSYSGSSVFGASAFTRGNNSIAVGYNAQVTGDSKIAIGTNAVTKTSGKSLYVDSGAEGIALGTNASSSDGGISIGYTATTSFNTWQMLPPIAIGFNSSAGDGNSIAIGGRASASGIGGIAIGPLASASGNASIAIGSNEYGQIAGNGIQPNTTAKGWANVSIGAFTNAGPSDNAVVVGPYSGASAYGTTAIGAYTKANGQYVTALGYNACSNVSGSNKTCIGANSGPGYSDSQASDSSEVIYIGTPSSTVYIPGHLVVGKNTILGARSVNDNVNYQVYLKGGNKGAYSSWVFLGTDDYKGGDDNFYRVDGVTAGAFTINGDNGAIYSDRRLKNVKGLNNDGLDKISELKVYNYNFKKDKKHMPRVGVIAQDLQKVFPNSVNKDKRGYLRIRWDEMFYAMVNAIKELNLKVKDLSEKFSTLNSRENSTDKKIDELYKKYNSLNNQVYNLKKENKALKAELKSVKTKKK